MTDKGSNRTGSDDAPSGAELFFGLVGAVGTDLGPVATALADALRTVEYTADEIRLSELLYEIDRWANLPRRGVTPEDVRIEQHMEAGSKFREALQRGDALATWALGAIRDDRAGLTGDEKQAAPRHAYILRQLKHPAEAESYRRLYGPSFILISAYSPRWHRVDALSRRIAGSLHAYDAQPHRARAEELVQKDEAEEGRPLGQNVSRVFPRADVFIDTTDTARMRASVQRFVELLFGNTLHTPRRDEFGMFQAQAARLRSADLGRQVGSAIATADGEIVALGTNDVPKAGGGLYWPEDDNDKRDLHLGEDPSRARLRALLADILRRLQNAGWLTEARAAQTIDDLVSEALFGRPIMEGAQFLSLMEFFRSIHAEQAALMDAAKRGVSVAGCTLYVTTFPCHECARLIVAAGIKRVVYIEPYPKSLVAAMYSDSVAVDQAAVAGRVTFEPFVGVAPARYIDLFTASERKTPAGVVVRWDGRGKRPRAASEPLSYIAQEDKLYADLVAAMREAGLNPTEPEPEAPAA
jgi:cytidine deaminase